MWLALARVVDRRPWWRRLLAWRPLAGEGGALADSLRAVWMPALERTDQSH